MESIDGWAAYVYDNFDASLKQSKDAAEFAEALASVWSTDRSYYLDLRKAMADYELERLDDMTLDQFESMLSDYVNPCPGSHISSGFGYRLWDHKVHLGLDLATGSRKIPTYAADSGTVVSAAFGHSVGNMIVINNGNGIVTKYMHHSKMYVKPGDHVVKGQQIGLAGTTGHSTGIHLHFQIEINGQPVNPLPYLKNTASEAIPVEQEEAKPLIDSPTIDLLTGFGDINLAVYNSVKLDAGDQL
jgi:murein DD-endopeptidase MepM/ murein hydrolase activator NlpD